MASSSRQMVWKPGGVVPAVSANSRVALRLGHGDGHQERAGVDSVTSGHGAGLDPGAPVGQCGDLGDPVFRTPATETPASMQLPGHSKHRKERCRARQGPVRAGRDRRRDRGVHPWQAGGERVPYVPAQGPRYRGHGLPAARRHLGRQAGRQALRCRRSLAVTATAPTESSSSRPVTPPASPPRCSFVARPQEEDRRSGASVTMDVRSQPQRHGRLPARRHPAYHPARPRLLRRGT
jgi:hypothetical protein